MSSEENKKLAAVITAAGLSSRMGDFKPLLPFGEGSIISRCVDNMKQAGAGEIIVVAGHRAEELKAHLAGSGCKVVINPRYAESHMFDSLCIGLRALEDGCGRVLISPVDVPAAKAETVKMLLEQEGGFVRPVFRGRAGHPVVLDGALIPAILSHGGEGGLRGAAESLKIAIKDIETEDEGVSVDADTLEDYKRILEIHRRDEK